MLEALQPRQFVTANPEAAGIGRLFLFLAAVRLWSVLVGAGYAALSALVPAWPGAPVVVGMTVTRVLGFAVPALLYVAASDLDVSAALPGREDAGAVLTAMATATALLAGAALVSNLAFGTAVAALYQHWYSPAVDFAFVARTTLVPAAAEAVGVGLLLFAVVQTRLRDLTTGEHAVALTVVVAAVFYNAPAFSLSVGRLSPETVALFAVSVAVSVALGLSLGLVYRGLVRGEDEAVLTRGHAPVLAVGALGALSVALTLLEFPQVVPSVLWLAALAAAATGYERTGTVWTPLATIFAYEVVLGVVVYLEVVTGLTPAV